MFLCNNISCIIIPTELHPVPHSPRTAIIRCYVQRIRIVVILFLKLFLEDIRALVSCLRHKFFVDHFFEHQLQKWHNIVLHRQFKVALVRRVVVKFLCLFLCHRPKEQPRLVKLEVRFNPIIQCTEMHLLQQRAQRLGKYDRQEKVAVHVSCPHALIHGVL